MKRKLFLTLGMILFGVLLAVLFIEVFFRVFPFFLPPEIALAMRQTEYASAGEFQTPFTGDPYLGYKLNPDVSTTWLSADFTPFKVKTIPLGFGGIGFRDEDVDSQWPFAVVVGDSFAFGHGVEMEEAWPEVLEKRLTAEVVNMGVPSYSSQANTRMFIKYGTKLKPKIVFWSLLPGYFSKSYRFEQFIKSGARDYYEWQRQKEGFKSAKLKPFIRRHRIIYAPLVYIRAILDKHSITYTFIRFSRWKLSEGLYESQRYDDENLHLVFHLNYYNEVVSDEMLRGEELTKESILEAKRVSEENDIQLVVVIFPRREQAYWHIVRELIDNPDETNVLDYVIDETVRFCEENDIRCIDLTPTFKRHAISGEQLYLRIDGHLNVRGNEVAAEAIYDFLVDNGLRPSYRR